MAIALSSGPVRSPLHAILLAFLFPLTLGTLFADLAYWRSFEIQWSNFAQWLNAGACLFGGLAIIAALASVIRVRSAGGQSGRAVVYLMLLVAAWIAAVVNALVHSQDAWAIMPEALWWSGLSAGLALLASWFGYSGQSIRGVR